MICAPGDGLPFGPAAAAVEVIKVVEAMGPPTKLATPTPTGVPCDGDGDGDDDPPPPNMEEFRNDDGEKLKRDAPPWAWVDPTPGIPSWPTTGMALRMKTKWEVFDLGS